jgi:hypothetical protein
MTIVTCPNCKSKIELGSHNSIPDKCPKCSYTIDPMQTLNYEVNNDLDEKNSGSKIFNVYCSICSHFNPIDDPKHLPIECIYCFTPFDYQKGNVFEIDKRDTVENRIHCPFCHSCFFTNMKSFEKCPKCFMDLRHEDIYEKLCLVCGEYYELLPWAGFECTNCMFKNSKK